MVASIVIQENWQPPSTNNGRYANRLKIDKKSFTQKTEINELKISQKSLLKFSQKQDINNRQLRDSRK